jgi:hypothetical protein
MPPGVQVPCHCPKCNGILVSVRTERNHRTGPMVRQQNIRPAAGRKGRRAITEPAVHHPPDSMSTQPEVHPSLEELEHVPGSSISDHSDHSAPEDLEDCEMHGNDGHAAGYNIDDHNVNLWLLHTE